MHFAYSEEKNQVLLATRGVGFTEILQAINQGFLLADIAHPSLQHTQQRIFVVAIGRYAYAVPYVINSQKQELFLKTAYPSRALTKKYLHTKRR